MSRSNISATRTALASALIAAFLAAIPPSARADAGTVLMDRVQSTFGANSNLNGASCYVVSPGVVVLYGTVFDDKDRQLAESTARRVRGVVKVVNTLRTKTGKWLEEESRINDTLQLNGFEGVQVRIIGNDAYLSGTVTSEAEVQRAIRTVTSVSKAHVINFMRVVPGSIF
jgi:osmotically-inducible protein OsmY